MLNSFVKRRQTTSALGRFWLQWLTEDFFRYFTKCPLVGDQAFVFFDLLFFFFNLQSIILLQVAKWQPCNELSLEPWQCYC